MSQDIGVAKRYAKALFEVAQQNQAISQVEDELKVVVEAVENSEDVKRFLQAPNIDLTIKLDVFRKAIEGKVSDAVLNLVNVLITNGRENMMQAVSDAYVKVAGQALGQADATVVSAYPLTAPEIELIAEHFGKVVNKKIRVHNKVDRSVIGGIQVRIGDRLYDGSISGKLARLEKSLKQSQAM